MSSIMVTVIGIVLAAASVLVVVFSAPDLSQADASARRSVAVQQADIDRASDMIESVR